MNEYTILTRKDTGEKFGVVLLSHWSDIRQVDGGLNYSVKWLGSDDYISSEGVRFTVSRYSDAVNNYLHKAWVAQARHYNSGTHDVEERKDFKADAYYYIAKALTVANSAEREDVVAYFKHVEKYF